MRNNLLLIIYKELHIFGAKIIFLINFIIFETVIIRNLNLTDLEMEKAAGKEFDDGHDEQGVKDEVYTKVVRAGKRTYFFDVKATRKDDYYLTVTESKKKLGRDGKLFYEKHKIFLYKEDFEKFMNGLTDAVSYIDSDAVGCVITNKSYAETEIVENDSLASDEYTNVEFEDLGEK